MFEKSNLEIKRYRNTSNNSGCVTEAGELLAGRYGNFF